MSRVWTPQEEEYDSAAHEVYFNADLSSAIARREAAGDHLVIRVAERTAEIQPDGSASIELEPGASFDALVDTASSYVTVAAAVLDQLLAHDPGLPTATIDLGDEVVRVARVAMRWGDVERSVMGWPRLTLARPRPRAGSASSRWEITC